jgi:hypothetical protein
MRRSPVFAQLERVTVRAGDALFVPWIEAVRAGAPCLVELVVESPALASGTPLPEDVIGGRNLAIGLANYRLTRGPTGALDALRVYPSHDLARTPAIAFRELVRRLRERLPGVEIETPLAP